MLCAVAWVGVEMVFILGKKELLLSVAYGIPQKERNTN